MTHGIHIGKLNAMLRGELAATETYQQAMAKAGDEPGSGELRTIHADHRETANEFRKHVRQFGGKPDQGSGVWGAFTKAVTGAAKLFGTAALKALKEGEEEGINTYGEALKEPAWPSECQVLINSALRRCKSHVHTLERLMQSK
jgi:uncharacterized protein (TIGR02284 family)